MSYKLGDEVVCTFDFDNHIQEFKLQIIGLCYGNDTDMLLCYVPEYVSVNPAFKLKKEHQRKHGFPDKFLGEFAVFVTTNRVIKHLSTIPGTCCAHCGTFIQWVEQSNYRCRACRENPYR